ncbi:hypothetical protein BpHYR1_008604 [Brachionus plicatilis]|uniref:Uncharacterized protein n=1 Tax=Brachionus plicatilis TaxID=10195 RepID=A0A3M7T337_BRAPC|nr:hypothetical protein BpHYR1_008604 [Brachionus plicatilis]
MHLGRLNVRFSYETSGKEGLDKNQLCTTECEKCCVREIRSFLTETKGKKIAYGFRKKRNLLSVAVYICNS